LQSNIFKTYPLLPSILSKNLLRILLCDTQGRIMTCWAPRLMNLCCSLRQNHTLTHPHQSWIIFTHDIF